MAITVNLNNGTGIGSTSFTEQTPVLLFAQSTSIFSTTGGNDPNNVDTITVAINNFSPTMVLSLNAAAASTATAQGVTVSYNSTTGVLTMTGNNELDGTWSSILQGVQYNDTSNAPNNPGFVTVTATNTGRNPGTDTQNISVLAVNDAPTVTSGATLNYTENSIAALISPSATIADADSANFNGGSLAVSIIDCQWYLSRSVDNP